MNALIGTHDCLALVEQHPDPHVLQSGNHPDRVVITQHTVNRPFKMQSDLRHFFESCLEWAEGLAAIITGQDTEVIRKAIKKLYQAAHCTLTSVRMHVADVQDSKPIKEAWNLRVSDKIVAYLNTLCILASTPVQAGHLQ